MTTEQRRALANTIPTTEVIRDAVTFPRDRLGEPLDISGPRFDAWLAQVRRDAARAALDGLAGHCRSGAERSSENGNLLGAEIRIAAAFIAEAHRDTHYPEEGR